MRGTESRQRTKDRGPAGMGGQGAMSHSTATAAVISDKVSAFESDSSRGSICFEVQPDFSSLYRYGTFGKCFII